MNPEDAKQPEEAFGTITGMRGPSIAVHLDSGETVFCRGFRRLHRTLGFFHVPVGRRAKVRFRVRVPRDSAPLLVEVLAAEAAVQSQEGGGSEP